MKEIKNPMQEIEIEKMVLNCGGLNEKLDRSVKLLELITNGRKISKIKSTKRLPAFGISPNKESGAKVTLRDKKQIHELLRRFFVALNNELSAKKVVNNQFSFGVQEYIEIPGFEYQREIGILGFEASVVFKRKGKSVKFKKAKRGKYPKRQEVTKQEIIEYLKNKFNLEILGK